MHMYYSIITDISQNDAMTGNDTLIMNCTALNIMSDTVNVKVVLSC